MTESAYGGRRHEAKRLIEGENRNNRNKEEERPPSRAGPSGLLLAAVVERLEDRPIPGDVRGYGTPSLPAEGPAGKQAYCRGRGPGQYGELQEITARGCAVHCDLALFSHGHGVSRFHHPAPGAALSLARRGLSHPRRLIRVSIQVSL